MCLAVSGLMGQTTVLSEDFGSSTCSLPTGWTNGSGSFEAFSFATTDGSNYSAPSDHTTGTGCYAWHDESGTDNGALDSPAMNLTGASSASLSFWYFNEEDASDTEADSEMHIDVSTDGGTNFTTDVAIYDGEYDVWTQFTVDLTSYVSSQTVVRFRVVDSGYFTSDSSIDDVEVTANFCAPPTANSPSITPNCGMGQFSIDVDVTALGDGTDVDILNDVNPGLNITGAGTGITTVGPFNAGENVTLTIDGSAYGGCELVLAPVTELCECNMLPTATILDANLDCGAGTFDIQVTVDSDGSGDANMTDILIDGAVVQSNATTGVMYTFNRAVGSYTVNIEAEGTAFVTCASSGVAVSASCNNDECAEAFNVTTDGTPTTSLDVTTYTDSGNNLSCDGGGSSEDAYYKFVAPASGFATITVDNANLSGTSINDVEGAIYASCGDAASDTEIECFNFGNPLNETQTVSGLTAGATYYLEVEHYNNDWTGTYDVSIFDPAPPIVAGVEECGDFSINTGDYTDTQTGAGCEPCSSSDPDWWTATDIDMVWTYVAASTGTVDIAVTDIANWDSGDNFTPEMGFMFTTDLSANCPSDVLAYGCNDNFTATKPDLTATGVAVTAGTTYYLVVAQEGSSTNNRTGTFCVKISSPCTGTTETITTPVFDCTAETFTGRINFSALGGGTTYELTDDNGTTISSVTTGTDYDFMYTDLNSHIVTLSGYDGSANLVCTQEFTLTSTCNGTDSWSATSPNILGTCYPLDFNQATIDGPTTSGPFAWGGGVPDFGNNSIRNCDNPFDIMTNWQDLWYQIDLPDGTDEFTLSLTGLDADQYAVFALYTGAVSTNNSDNAVGTAGVTISNTNGSQPNVVGSVFSSGVTEYTISGLTSYSTAPIYIRVMPGLPDPSSPTLTCADMNVATDILSICATAPQPNDVCNNAINVTTNNLDDTGVASTGDLTLASDEGNSINCAGVTVAGADLWYEVLYPDYPSVVQDFFTELSLTGNAGDQYIINVFDVTAACGSAGDPTDMDHCEMITLTGGTDITTLGDIVSTDGQSREIQIIAVNATGPITVEANVTFENNNCSHFQNVLPGYDIENPQSVTFNYSTDSGSDPVTAGNDLWYAFDPISNNDGFALTYSTSANLTVSGLTGDQEITVLTYLGDSPSANNCNDLAGSHLSSFNVTSNGTFNQAISCLDDTHGITDGGYLVRIVQTAGSTSANPTVTVTPNAPAQSNNTYSTICSGTSPAIGPSGNPNSDAGHNWNQYWIQSGETLVGQTFAGANDCDLSGVCNAVDYSAITESNDRDLWYMFEVPTNQCTSLGLTQSTVTTSMDITYDANDNTHDGVAFVYNACDTSTPLDCSGSLDGEGETWTINGLTQGQFYLLRVKPWDISSAATGWAFDIGVTDGNPAPCNDKVADAESLTVNTGCSSTPWYPALDTYSALGARDEETFGQRDVFFKFTAPLPANGGAYNPTTHPTYAGQESSWVNVFLENVSGHIVNMELWNTQTIVATATQYETSSTAGDKIWARFGNLEPGAEYEIRLYHGETITTDVQYKIRVEAGENTNTVTDCDAGNFAGAPILCGSCGGEDSTPYLTDPVVSSLNSSGDNNHCEIWYKIDLPEMAGGSGTYWVAEVEGYEQILDFELRQQIATESLTHGTQEDFDHPCSSRPLSNGNLVNSYPVTYELLNNAPTYSSIMLNGMGSSATECTVSCSAAENTSRGGGYRKVYEDILGPAPGQKNYLYMRVFMHADDPSYTACHDGGVMINPANVLFRGPYSSDPTTGSGAVVPGAPDLSCLVAIVDWDSDGVADNVDLDADNDGIPDNLETPYGDPYADADNDGTPNFEDEDYCTVNSGTFSGGLCSLFDSDGDGKPNHLDLDADDDGIPDLVEAGGVDADGNGQVDNINAGNQNLINDNDNDGWADAYDNDNNDDATAGTPQIIKSDLDTDNDGHNDFVDLDSDNDGIPDILEANPSGNPDPDNDGKVGTGTCNDVDDDGFCDTYDPSNTVVNDITSPTAPGGSPMFTMTNPNRFECGAGILCNVDATGADEYPNHLDIDADNDGILDIIEAGGMDIDGNGLHDGSTAGNPQIDTNGNGWADEREAGSGTASCPAVGGFMNPTGIGNAYCMPNNDGTGLPNWLDIDADDDGVVDNVEGSSTASYALPDANDMDGDGLDDQYDNFNGFGGVGTGTESDGSSISAGTTNNPYDKDGDMIPDYLDLDTDGDLVPDVDEAWDGTDADDVSDITGCGTTDIDNDGLLDCYDSDTANPTVTSYNTTTDNGFNSGNTAPSSPTSGDTPDDIFPDNGGLDNEADWRDVSNTISGMVFLDNYADGTQGNANGDNTGTDTPIQGITVTLTNTVTMATQSTTTLADGSYIFRDLADGTYTVTFGTNDGSTTYDAFTTQNAGTDTSIDSDANPATGITTDITLNSGNRVADDIDAGIYEYVSIDGTLYTDQTFTTPAANQAATITITYCTDIADCANNTSTMNVNVTTDGAGDFSITDADMVVPGIITSINSSYGNIEGANVVNSNQNAPSGSNISLQDFALPVELVVFRGKAQDDVNVLEWITATEVNSEVFIIERSVNPDNGFEVIGNVEAAGQSHSAIAYEFTDEFPLGQSYYRLRMLDLDGTFEYSNVIHIQRENNDLELHQMVPNPTMDKVNITFENTKGGQVEVIIMNVSGQIVQQTIFETDQQIQNIEVDLSSQVKGVYFISLRNGTTQVTDRILLMND